MDGWRQRSGAVGIRRWKRGLARHLYSSLVCDGVGKVWRRRSEALAEVRQRCGNKKKLCYSILTSLHTVGPCGQACREAEINNVTADSERGTGEKEGAVNTGWRY